MIIQVDKEGKSVIEALCDLALKAGGIKNLPTVEFVLNSIKLIEEQKQEDDK